LSTASVPCVWVFDLDNTLHDASPHIFPHLTRAMTQYLREHLALDEAEANAMRVRYWKRYGATLNGLMRHHGTDPHHFLHTTHRFPELHRMIVADRAALAAIARLPGRKVVFSNAPAHYAEAVLELLGLHRFFAAVYGIEQLGFAPKPSPIAFRRLLRAERIAAARCVLVEDTLENLRTACRLGMRTVWVTREHRSPRWLDLRVQSVGELRRYVDRFLR
jgi:putative hydrolase of the HAD superfamily